MGEEEVDVSGRGQAPAVAAAHRCRVFGAQPAHNTLDRLLDHLDLGARDPQLEVVKVFQADPLGSYLVVS